MGLTQEFLGEILWPMPWNKPDSMI